MARQKDNLLNRLERELPEGLVVDASWLKQRGYSRQLLNHYVKHNWLVQPARGIYRRPRGGLKWQQVVISLQNLLDHPVIVGGRTALELQGFAHYLVSTTTEVHLYASEPLPGWLHRLSLETSFRVHNTAKIFRNHPITRGLTSLDWNVRKQSGVSNDAIHAGFVIQSWGQWDWPLTLSTPERAILELLDELPNRETFHQVDQLFGSLTTLSPRRVEKLLADCRSVKVKRLFFFFARRHKHAWLKRLDPSKIDLGKGKRMLVRGGKLDPVTQITVPEDLDGVR